MRSVAGSLALGVALLAPGAQPTTAMAAEDSIGLCVSAETRALLQGEMRQLLAAVHGIHAALAEPLIEAGVDRAILVGDEMTALADELGKSPSSALGKAIPFAHCQTVAEAIEAVAALGVESGDAILVKGSNSVGLGKLVAALAQRDG